MPLYSLYHTSLSVIFKQLKVIFGISQDVDSTSTHFPLDGYPSFIPACATFNSGQANQAGFWPKNQTHKMG